MEDVLRRLSQLLTFDRASLVHLIDILIVAFVVYKLLRLARGTRAWRVLGGVLIFVAALFLSDYFGLRTLHWILDKATILAPVALVILLLPELRQALEGFARLGLWPEALPRGDRKTAARTVEEVVAAVSELSSERIGALIVIERGNQLTDIAESGVILNAEVSAPFIGSIFYENNPLHDGALLIRGDKAIAAACRLPVSESPAVEGFGHLRHRAGVGITEQSDAIAIIVSEERGTISVAVDGTIRRLRDHGELRDFLNSEVRGVHADRPRRKLLSRLGGRE